MTTPLDDTEVTVEKSGAVSLGFNPKKLIDLHMTTIKENVSDYIINSAEIDDQFQRVIAVSMSVASMRRDVLKMIDELNHQLSHKDDVINDLRAMLRTLQERK